MEADTTLIQGVGPLRGLMEGQTTSNGLIDEFAVDNGGIDDHPAIEIESRSVFWHYHLRHMVVQGHESQCADDYL